MTLYITEISKYIIAILSIVFALSGLCTLKFKSEKKRAPLYFIQIVSMFAIDFLCFLQIYVSQGDATYLFYGIIITFILASTILLFKAIFPDANRLVIINMCFALQTSMIILLRINETKALRQIIIAFVSIVIMFIVCKVIYKYVIFSRLTYVYAIGGFLMLFIVRILGSITHGSYLSISVFGLTFQPSEFVKIIFVLFLACELCGDVTYKESIICFAVTILHVCVLLFSKDLGASAILYVIFICVLFAASGRYLYVFTGVIFAGLGSVLSYFMFAHVRTRVTAFLDPWTNIDGSGYQITQSLFGISSGGFWGLGLFNGNPDSIPYVEDDFIFSAIAQEFGIIYASCLVLSILAMFLMMLLEARRLKDKWSRLVNVGLATSIIFQTFLTVGGGCKFIPLTGVTLPFVSMGGSSLMSTIIMVGIFEATSIIRADEHYEAVEKYRRMMNEKKNFQGANIHERGMR